MSTISNFTVTNVDIGKFRYNWVINGPTPQKITISLYSDSGYTTVVSVYSTDPYISSSGQPDFNVTDTSFTIPNILSSATTYYSQIVIVPQGITTITTSVYVSSNERVPIPRIAVNQSNVIPLNYTVPVVYNFNSIGSYYLNGTPSAYFNGYINNLSLYNRTLTTGEIANYFQFTDSSSFTSPLYAPLPIKLSNFYQTVADAPMYLYYDADSLNQIQGYYAGSSVALWNNLGTEGNAASLNARGAFVGTGVGGYLPTLQQTGGANNYRYFVQFAGSGNSDAGPGNFFTLPPMQFNFTTGFTFIFVANIPSTGTWDRVIDFNNASSSANDSILIGRNTATTNLAFYIANSTTTIINWVNPSNSTLDATWRIYAIRVTPSNFHYFYNTGTGTKLIDTNALGTVPTSRTYGSAHYTSNGSTRYGSFIGRSNWNDNFSSMKLGELLVYRSALSDNAINGIINVMQKRWNLDTPRTNIDFEFTQNVATFPRTDNTGKTLTTTVPPGMTNDPVRGYVASLNGSTQFFTISSYNISASYTKMFWIYVNSVTGNAHIMSSTNSGTNGVHYMYFAGINNLSVGHSSGTTVTPIVTDPQSITPGLWTHYAVTYENASGAASGYAQYAMTLYRNGQQVAQFTNVSNNWTGGSATTGVTIGGFGGTVTGFIGLLDKMRIYARALKQTEIQLIYGSEKLNIPSQNYTSSSMSATVTILYTFTTFTFTNVGVTGTTGPTLAQLRSNAGYSAQSWTTDTTNNYLNMTTQGIQLWTVPRNGSYQIIAAGAVGGNNTGRGVIVTSIVTLTAGNQLKILIGQKGSAIQGDRGGGGGGGSFVLHSNNNPILIAGGGGGTSALYGALGTDGILQTTSANNGSAGQGGAGANSAGGGGGLNGDGGNTGGLAFINGATGRSGDRGNGGFGCGGQGGNSADNSSGGGGGYSGGNAGNGGKGGASYDINGVSNNTATLYSGGITANGGTYTTGYCTGDGFVIIRILPLYSFTSFTFTNVGITGPNGPTLAQLRANAGYSAQSWTQDTTNNYLNMTSQGIQLWTVPFTGTYQIIAAGAGNGGGVLTVGRGIIVSTTTNLTGGQVIKILVGQLPSTSGSAGGGTFVSTGGNSAILVAGGGGANYGTTITGPGDNRAGRDASFTTSGVNSGNNGSLGGTNGGAGGSSDYGTGAGGGFTGGGNGTNGNALSYIGGGTGGDSGGGFGGGGGVGTGAANPLPGGGGGYSGGGAGSSQGVAAQNGAGGGGSYDINGVTNNTATLYNQSITANGGTYTTGYCTGNGFVQISFMG